MLDKPGNSEVQPVNPERPLPARPGNGRSPLGRTVPIAVISLAVWTAVMLGLVRAGALQIAPAIVLIVLAALVLGIEVKRAQGRGPRRNRFGEMTEHQLESPKLDGLLEIEQANLGEERRVLLAREFCRLSAEALQSDPAERATWPVAESLEALRQQITLLHSSATDPRSRQLPPGHPAGHLTDDDLRQAIEALTEYVDRLSRLRRIASHDPEPIRQLAREQRRLRELQDQIVSQLRQPTGDE
ncbi:MAG TPA: hypothetical protein VHA53_10510 [Nitrolancea sp.]|nr:hypothetical protein [Nitrolancea sp.]